MPHRKLNNLDKMDVLHESIIIVNRAIDLDRAHIVRNGVPSVLSRGNSTEEAETETDDPLRVRSRSIMSYNDEQLLLRSRSNSCGSDNDNDNDNARDRARSRSRSRSRSNSIDNSNGRGRSRSNSRDSGDFTKDNPVFKNPIYPDLMNTKSNSNRFITESRSQFRKHKVLASSGKIFSTDRDK